AYPRSSTQAAAEESRSPGCSFGPPCTTSRRGTRPTVIQQHHVVQKETGGFSTRPFLFEWLGKRRTLLLFGLRRSLAAFCGLLFFLGLLGFLDYDAMHADLGQAERTPAFLPAFFIFQDFDAFPAREDVAGPFERVFPAKAFIDGHRGNLVLFLGD